MIKIDLNTSFRDFKQIMAAKKQYEKIPGTLLSDYVESIRFRHNDQGSIAIVRFIVAQDVYLPIIEEFTLQVCAKGDVICYKEMASFILSSIKNKYIYEQLMKEILDQVSVIKSGL